jgi:glycosyltransferase involved in cell wall biosynthesis
MFSVLIPLYNKERSIKNTIQSVLDQNFNDFEIIVVNDGSTDNSPEIVKQFVDPRIRLIHQENQGVSAARNRGIKEAKYEWIAFLDGDDLWREDHLETVKNMISSYPKESVFITDFAYSDGRNRFKHKRLSSVSRIEDYFKESIKELLISSSAIVINKKSFAEIGYFNTGLIRGEDRDIWDRLARRYAIIKTTKETSIYKVEAENRACNNRHELKNTYVSLINLGNTHGSERAYLKHLIILELKRRIVSKDIQSMLSILIKHNIQLLK